MADECCNDEIVKSLRAAGFDVAYMIEHNSGASDEDILLSAYNEKRILLTEDKDFGARSKNGTRSEAGARDMPGSKVGRYTRSMGSTKCRQQWAGHSRMPCGEEHRKAVCGKTACTV